MLLFIDIPLTIFPKITCVGNIDIQKKEYGGTSASVDIEPTVLDPLVPLEENLHYKLRHRNSKLFVESVKLPTNGKRVIFGVGMSGMKWESIGGIFVDLKKHVMKTDYQHKLICDEPLLEQLREDLLHFEIVYFGEVKADDMTFHINELGKM